MIHTELLFCLWLCPAGQLAAGTCEVVTLDRDSSQPRRTIARQTARCACKKGQIAGTTRARPACVDGKIKFGETVNQNIYQYSFVIPLMVGAYGWPYYHTNIATIHFHMYYNKAQYKIR